MQLSGPGAQVMCPTCQIWPPRSACTQSGTKQGWPVVHLIRPATLSHMLTCSAWSPSADSAAKEVASDPLKG